MNIPTGTAASLARVSLSNLAITSSAFFSSDWSPSDDAEAAAGDGAEGATGVAGERAEPISRAITSSARRRISSALGGSGRGDVDLPSDSTLTSSRVAIVAGDEMGTAANSGVCPARNVLAGGSGT
jgi:hypothetical protein